MSTPIIEQDTRQQPRTAGEEAAFDPFAPLDIEFIEHTPAANTVLTCSTGDTCGSSCPSACTTS